MGLVIGALVVWIRGRWHGRRLRLGLGRVTRLERAPSAGFGVLRGRLRCAARRHGVAMASVSSSLGPFVLGGACCPGLELESQGTRVRLVGQTEVILGSRETDTATVLRQTDEGSYYRVARAFPSLLQVLTTPGAVLRLVELGDEVVVAGRIERVGHPESGVGYRESAHRWVLSGGRSAALVAAIRPRQPSLTWLVRLMALGACALLWLCFALPV